MNRDNNIPFTIVLDNRLLAILSERSYGLPRELALIDLVSRRVDRTTTVSKHDRTIELQPGEAETSIRVLAKDWEWDRKTVRRFLSALEECGFLQMRKSNSATISSFPTLSGSTTETVPSSTTEKENCSPSGNHVPSTIGNVVQMGTGEGCARPSIRYDEGPLELDAIQQEQIRTVYDMFHHKLPLLDRPTFDQRTQKAIYHVFILGMSGDLSLMEQYLDRIARDDSMNGELSLITGSRKDCESFASLFSPKWMELLYPAQKQT